MNILLINLPRDGEVVTNLTPEYLLHDFMNYPPLGLLAIAAGVHPRHNLQVLDTVNNEMTIEDIINYVKDRKPDILGISVVTWRLFPMYDISKRVKEISPRTKIVVGGPHVTDHPEEVMELGCVDFAVTGFGEKKFPVLVEAIDKGDELLLESISGLYYKVDGNIETTPTEEASVNLDDLPFPNRTLLNLDDYFTLADKVKMTTVYTSRGCPFRCIFCDVGIKKYYYRSAKRIVDEFEHIARLGIEEIHIFDDTFNLRRQRVIDMCKEMLARGLDVRWSARARVYPADEEMISLMKQAGCNRLHVGVEVLDPDLLKYIKKNITMEQIDNFFKLCNKYGIDTLAYFMVGFPQETREYRKSFYKGTKKLNPTYVYVNILEPLANTEFYDSLVRDGVYEEDFWEEFVKKPVRDFEIPSYRSPEEDEELLELVDDIHRKFYLSPRFIFNDLRRTASFELLGRKAKAAISLISTYVKRGGKAKA